MTHAARVAEAEREVLEKAQFVASEFRQVGPEGRLPGALAALTAAVDALLALRAATCPECGGDGLTWYDTDREGRKVPPYSGPCHTGCDHGRKVTP